jgi:hypothetical protein
MKNYMRCNQCGYDLYGPEYVAHTLDANLYTGNMLYTQDALLNVCTQDSSHVTCPFCHTTGDWSTF